MRATRATGFWIVRPIWLIQKAIKDPWFVTDSKHIEGKFSAWHFTPFGIFQGLVIWTMKSGIEIEPWSHLYQRILHNQTFSCRNYVQISDIIKMKIQGPQRNFLDKISRSIRAATKKLDAALEHPICKLGRKQRDEIIRNMTKLFSKDVSGNQHSLLLFLQWPK